MLEFSPVRRSTALALAGMLAAAPLAAHAQSTASQGDKVKTRVLAWPATDRLSVSVRADVRYVEGASAKAVITGPAREIDDIVVDGGHIRHRPSGWGWDWWGVWGWRDWRSKPDIQIVVTAPHVAEAGVSGAGHLDLGRLVQDRLDLAISGSGGIDVSGQFKSLGVGISGSGAARLTQIEVGDMTASLSGSGWIKATGAARALHLGVSGSGVADLGGLIAQDVEAHLSGSGSARLSPKQSADLAVSGSGAIRLLTEPPRLNTHRSGSGEIIRANGSF
jgi:hypothetical protein